MECSSLAQTLSNSLSACSNSACTPKIEICMPSHHCMWMNPFWNLDGARVEFVLDPLDIGIGQNREVRLPNPSRDFLQRQKSARCTSLLNGRGNSIRADADFRP